MSPDDEVNTLGVPGVSSQTVVQAALDYCDGRGDCGVGETQVVINLPEAVPQGKVLSLRIEIAGSYGEPLQCAIPFTGYRIARGGGHRPRWASH